jgi:hypothetical protein
MQRVGFVATKHEQNSQPQKVAVSNPSPTCETKLFNTKWELETTDPNSATRYLFDEGIQHLPFLGDADILAFFRNWWNGSEPVELHRGSRAYVESLVGMHFERLRSQAGFEYFWVVPEPKWNCAIVHTFYSGLANLLLLWRGETDLAVATTDNFPSRPQSNAASETCEPTVEKALLDGRLDPASSSAHERERGTLPEARQRTWYYSLDRRTRTGPVTAAQIRQLIKEGLILQSSLVSLDGEKWHFASRLKGVNWPLDN